MTTASAPDSILTHVCWTRVSRTAALISDRLVDTQCALGVIRELGFVPARVALDELPSRGLGICVNLRKGPVVEDARRECVAAFGDVDVLTFDDALLGPHASEGHQDLVCPHVQRLHRE